MPRGRSPERREIRKHEAKPQQTESEVFELREAEGAYDRIHGELTESIQSANSEEFSEKYQRALALHEQLESGGKADVKLASQVFLDQAETDFGVDRLEIIKHSEKMKFHVEDAVRRGYIMKKFFLTQSEDNVRQFWKNIESNGSPETLRHQVTLRFGYLGEVAAFKLMEDAGEQPTLTLPHVDMHSQMDIFASVEDMQTAFQIKTGGKHAEFIRVEDRIAPGGIEVKANDKNKRILEHHSIEAGRVSQKLSEYNENADEPIDEVYVLVLPVNGFDNETGEPKPKMKNFFQKKIQQFISEREEE